MPTEEEKGMITAVVHDFFSFLKVSGIRRFTEVDRKESSVLKVDSSYTYQDPIQTSSANNE